MIFGFNTDMRHAGTVYHVQSEARVPDLLLQTQVFVQGRCIGKHATSYAAQASRPGFSEHEIHELLKLQHRLVLDSLRDGCLEALFAAGSAVRDAAGDGLALEWLSGGAGELRVRVTNEGRPVAHARVLTRLDVAHDAPVHSEALTAADGVAELMVRCDAADTELAILVQATSGAASVSRKFRLKKS